MTELIDICITAAKRALRESYKKGYIRDEGSLTKLDGDFDIEAVVLAIMTAMRNPTKKMLDVGLAEISLWEEEEPSLYGKALVDRMQKRLAKVWRLMVGTGTERDIGPE